MAGALEAKQFVFAGHGTRVAFPVAKNCANVADKRSDARHGGNEQMVGSATAKIERKAALGDLAAKQRVSRLQLEKARRQSAMGNQFDEELEGFFVGRGNHGIGALGSKAVTLDAERGVLSRAVFEWATGIDAQDAQIRRDIAAVENARVVIPIRRAGHLKWLSPSVSNLPFVASLRNADLIHKPARRQGRKWRRAGPDTMHQPRRRLMQARSRQRSSWA